MDTDYSCLTITFPAEYAEIMNDLLHELGTLGCQMQGDDPLTLVAYFEGRDNLDAIERVVRLRMQDAGLEGARLAISRGATPRTDWEAVWRQSLSPVRVGRRWLVRPSWQSSEGFRRETLVIDPKMAFGTGTHATTQLCLVELETLVKPGMSVLDVGTGTAILAIAAARLGAGRIVGVDVDPEAVECAKENLALNGLTGRIELVLGTLDDVPPLRVDLVIANIEYRTLVGIGRKLKERLQPGGMVLFSGILQIEAETFLAEIRRIGWRPLRARRQYDPMTNDGWVSCVATPEETASGEQM